MEPLGEEESSALTRTSPQRVALRVRNATIMRPHSCAYPAYSVHKASEPISPGLPDSGLKTPNDKHASMVHALLERLSEVFVPSRLGLTAASGQEGVDRVLRPRATAPDMPALTA